jgi:uncharacterized membrane protein
VSGVAVACVTGRILSLGALLGAACFAIALIADVAGVGDRATRPADAPGLVAALVALSPSAWAAVGVAIIVGTPAIGLVTTALEFRAAADLRAALLALGVLLILAASLVVAVAR